MRPDMRHGLRFPPGVPQRLRGRLIEVARREWRDPDAFGFDELEEFLRSAGLCWPERPGAGGPVGAGLLLSGDIRTQRGASRPQPSPADGVPAACAVVYAAGSCQEAPTVHRARIGGWRQSWTAAEHAGAISEIRSAIAAGDVYQVNIVGHQSAPFTGAPEVVGPALARLANTPYAGGMSGAGWSVFAASPECLLDVHDGVAVSRPIKGTVATSTDPALDDQARVALLRSGKDRAEHIMIVDLARNDLGRVATVGGVAVPELYAVRRLAGVWHAESTVSARITAGVGLATLLSAVFPGGSVTGAPKLAALDLIDRFEPVGRGPSMGALGWIGNDGDISLGLTIRTVVVTGGRVHLWTGGGITWGSDPRAEVAEAAVKAAPLLAALAAMGD